MKSESLRSVNKNFKHIVSILAGNGLRDSGIRHRYAEYLVALELSKRGHRDIQLLNERTRSGADIYLAKEQIAVEVKSGMLDEENWAAASFGRGNQIKYKKFDFCVFVVFCNKHEGKVEDIFIFSRNELQEVTKPRRGIAKHLDTNPCLLMIAPNIKEYNKYLKGYKYQSLKIEYDLNKDRGRYSQKWGKIKKMKSSN